MYYVSTRDKSNRRMAAEAIAQGLAADGGLFTPEVFPKLSHNALQSMKDMSYQQRAVYIMNAFLDDYSAAELTGFAKRAYGDGKFSAKEVAPVAEKMITLAKKNDLSAYRQALAFITKEDVAHKLFTEMNQKYMSRDGGYTRIVRMGPRRGDAAEMAIIQLV